MRVYLVSVVGLGRRRTGGRSHPAGACDRTDTATATTASVVASTSVSIRFELRRTTDGEGWDAREQEEDHDGDANDDGEGYPAAPIPPAVVATSAIYVAGDDTARLVGFFSTRRSRVLTIAAGLP